MLRELIHRNIQDVLGKYLLHWLPLDTTVLLQLPYQPA